jgi:hypothetical protein
VGIDDSFISAILLINELGDENHSIDEGQIILTTGLNKYQNNLNFIFSL